MFVKNENDLDKILEDYKNKKVFLIGGAKIYNDLIDKCDTALITKLDKEFDADTFFPDLESHGFKITEESNTFKHDDIKYKFIKYQK